MVEFPCDQCRRLGVAIKVRLFAGHFEMPAAREVTVDLLFAHDLFDGIDGDYRSSVHTLNLFAAVARDQGGHGQLHPGQHHASVARTGAPAERLRFQHRDSDAALR